MLGTILAMKGANEQAAATAQADYAKRDMDNAAANETLKQTGIAQTAAETNSQQQLGGIRAAYGASGVAMNGTAALTMNSQAGIMQAKISAMTEEGTFKASQLIQQGKIENQAGQNALDMGQIKEGEAAFGGWLKDATAMAG